MITSAEITTALDGLLALRKRYPLAAMPFIALCPFPCNGRIIGLVKFGEPTHYLCERCSKPVQSPLPPLPPVPIPIPSMGDRPQREVVLVPANPNNQKRP